MAVAQAAVVLTALLAAVPLISGSGTCLRCYEDFNVFAGRRGYGGGRYYWLDTAATAATDIGFFNDPSTGWRAYTETNLAIKQGNANFWIGGWSPTASNIHQRQPELLLRYRLQTVGPTDAGTFLIRASTSTTVPSATGMCTGGYAGAYFCNEKWGLVNDFSHLSVRVAKWDVGLQSSGVGLVFNVRHTFSGFTGYTAIFRQGNSSSTPNEVCAGIYKTVNGANVALTSQQITNPAIIPNATNKLNPTLATTALSARTFVRIGVSKAGGVISLWFNTPSNIVLTVTDSSPLPAGVVGVAGIAANSAVFDDVVLNDSPTCTDGLWNGGETGIDCGGFSDVQCPACSSVIGPITHNFGTDALVGWYREGHGSASNSHAPVYSATGITFTTNTGLNWAGSNGINCAGWFNGWFWLASKFPPAQDVDLSFDVGPVDNDWFGLVWRWQDHNNYYDFIMRQEHVAEPAVPFTIQRRRNGFTTNLYIQYDQYPDPYVATSLRQTIRLVHVGNFIQVYSSGVLVGQAVDPDPMNVPGLVGVGGGNQQNIVFYSFTYKSTAPAPTTPIQPSALSISPAAVSALTLHLDATTLPLLAAGTMRVWRGLSAFGLDVHNSPSLLPTASMPGTVAGVVPIGNAVNFAGSQFLLATTYTAIEPAIQGMTLVISFSPTATVVTGSAGVIIAKGLRDRPFSAYASGWRLHLTVDRAIPGYAAGTLALNFYAQAAEGVAGADRIIDIATPVAVQSVYTVSINVYPNSTTGALDTRTFSVSATINNASWADMGNCDLQGIVSASTDAYVSIGATDVQTDGAKVAVLEVQAYAQAVGNSDLVNTINYQMGRYVPGIQTCPVLSIANGYPSSGMCTNGTQGSTCTLSCNAGYTMISGSATTTCLNGRWVGKVPRCEVVCPDLIAVGTGTNCRSQLFVEQWSAGNGLLGSWSGSSYRHWDISPVSGDHVSVVSPGRVAVSSPFGFRYGDLTYAVVSGPTWASVTSRLSVKAAAVLPTSLRNTPVSVVILPRFQDAANYYAVDTFITMDPNGANTTIFRRVKAGVETQLCNINSDTVPIAAGRLYNFEVVLGQVSGSSATIMIMRDGVTVCQVVETTANYITAGTAGFGVSGIAGFDPVTFSNVTVENFPATCPTGCSGVMAGGTCTLPCNSGTVPRGSNTRMCLANGTYSATPLVCDNGAPLLSDYAASVAELSAIGANVGVAPPVVFASGKAGSGAVVFEIVSGNENGAFSIDSCSGQLKIANPDKTDFERVNFNSTNAFTLRLRAYVPGTVPVAESFQIVSVTVTDANDPPMIKTVNCTVAENSGVGSPVCVLAIVDPDTSTPTAVFSYLFEEVAGQFSLADTSGAITVGRANLDFETKNQYRVVVRAADPAFPAVFSSATVLIFVSDVAEAPVMNVNTAFTTIDASKVVAGYIPPTSNALSCWSDPDAGSTKTLVSASVIGSTVIFSINNDGSMMVVTSRSYTSVTPYLKDGFLVVDYAEYLVTVRDNTLLQGQGVYKVYVLANVTGILGPLIRTIAVLPRDTASGSGNIGGKYLLNTDGTDSITFNGDNMLFYPSDVINATATTADGVARNYSVGCRYIYTGAMSGSQPLADGILCPTKPGYGVAWAWTISIMRSGSPVTVVPGIALVTSYAPPVITSIGPPGLPGQPMNYVTSGNQNVALLGYNFGPATAPVTVQLGKMDPLTGTITWSYALTSVSASHASINAKTPAGNGAGLLVRVTVGSQTVQAPSAITFAYLPPTISGITLGISRAGGVVLPVYSGVKGGDTITINGANFGPAGPGVTFTFGTPAWPLAQLPYVATCTHSNLTAQHTQVVCTVPNANGGYHTGYITVAGQSSARTANVAATRVTYASGYIATVSGPGARAADTRGGSIVYFTGWNLGPASVVASGLCPAPYAVYGMSNGTGAGYVNLKYTMSNCQILDEAGTQMSCQMVEGTGYTPPYWRWSIVGCGTGWTGLLGTIRYAPPVVLSFEADPALSPGTAGADTRGGQAVIIRGLNFGPTMEYVSASYYAKMTDSKGVLREVQYNATGCFKPANDARQLPHQMMTCYTVPGAGTGLRWEVIVETQRSVALTSAYALPTITAISSAPPASPVVAVSAADDLGGQQVYVLGTQFGPRSASTLGRSLVQWVRFGPNGGQSTDDAYTPLAFTHIVDNSAIAITLPPGIGKNLLFQVSVADVVSAVSTAVMSYADPRVTALSTSTGGTRGGGQPIKVFVTGAGLLDITTDHNLLFNGKTVAIVDRFPTRERVIAAGTNFSMLSADELDRSKHYVAFVLPAGSGAGNTVSIKAYRVPSPASSVTSTFATDFSANANVAFSYTSPTVTTVAADRLDSPAVINITAQYLTGLSPAELDEYRFVTVLGTNLGPAAAGGLLEVATCDVGGVLTSAYSSTQYITAVVSWSHERITAIVQLSQASVRVSIPPVNVAYGSTMRSNEAYYFDVSPSVLGITSNVPAGGFDTRGGGNVVITAQALASFNSLSAFIGGNAASFLADDGVTQLSSSQVKSQQIDVQYATQIGAGVQPKDMIFSLRLLVPAGQGSSVSIVLVRDGVNGTGPVYISYAAPHPQTIAKTAVAGSDRSVTLISAMAPYRIPTTGSSITITGVDFGTCPVVIFGMSRGAACMQDQQPNDDIVVFNYSHTSIVAQLPAGVGMGSQYLPPGIFLEVHAGDQSSPQIAMAYNLPSIASITTTDPAGFPTAGGVRVNITGSDFGPSTASSQPVVKIYLSATDVVLCGSVARDAVDPHHMLTCTLPAGAGVRLSVEITVGDQSSMVAGMLSYNRPIVYSVRNADVNATGDFNRATGRPMGGYLVTILGRDLSAASSSCIFLPHSAVPAEKLICNGMADSWDEQEVPAANILLWNDTIITFTMPPGVGRRSVRVLTRNAMSTNFSASSDVWQYKAPVIYSMTPATADTDSSVLITLTGRDFGFGNTIGTERMHQADGWMPSAFPLDLAVNTDPNSPSPFALRVNFFTALSCISSAKANDTASAMPAYGVTQCQRGNSGMFEDSESTIPRPYGIVTHTDDTIIFTSLPGIGKNRNLTLSIVSPDGSETISNVLTFSYTAPSFTAGQVYPASSIKAEAITVIEPPAGAANRGRYAFASMKMQFGGKNFGLSSQEPVWSTAERAVEITINGNACSDPSRQSVGGATLLQCQFGLDTASGVPIDSPALPRVGYQTVHGKVAGQETLPSDPKLLQIVCAKGYYGLPGEVCLDCPYGATCAGYSSKSVVNDWSHVNMDGVNVTECLSCYSSPVASKGFFNMKGFVKGDGSSDSVCDPVRKAEQLRSTAQCEYIVPCDPPESCLAGNVCADGYANSKWPYRCSQCADGFFRQSGFCKKCPDNPALTVVFFFVVALVAIAAGWFLNQKQVNIAFLTIGLDYMQVLAIFANTRVAWPDQIKDLFHILSAFNLNIEIIAPECAFKGITFADKWIMIMALPIVVFVLLCVFHVFNIIVLAIRGQNVKKQAASAASPLIAMSQVLMYFLYLYITRSVFDVMTCRPSDPPEYDAAGNEKMFMAGLPGEQCGIAGGTQVTLLPVAIAALIVYTIGYPSLIGWNLWKNRELVMEDQLLRTKRTGEDRLTNPHAFDFRRRFSRTYYQFKPDAFLWVLAIICRKFLIAISSLVFNTNQNFQMAAMLLVLFLAYAAQVRFLPYMGSSNFDQVLKDHLEAARQCHPIHLRLAATLAGIETRGRKQTRVFTFGGAKRLSAKDAAGLVAAFLFDYNTVEATLIASAFLVSLSGVMFGATQASSGSSFYQQSRDGVVSLILLVIGLSLIYWLSVVFVELYFIFTDNKTRKHMAEIAKSREARMAKKGADGSKSPKKGRKSSEDENDDEIRKASVDFNVGPINTENNPLFMNSGSAAGQGVGLDTDAIRGMATVPTQGVWDWIRSGFLETANQIDTLEEEKKRLIEALAAAQGGASSSSGLRIVNPLASTPIAKQSSGKSATLGKAIAAVSGKGSAVKLMAAVDASDGGEDDAQMTKSPMGKAKR